MSSRADDLTADLLHDLTTEQQTPPAPATQPRQAPERTGDGAAQGAPFVDTDFFLAPQHWKRPGIARDRGALAFRAGPVQVRIGRRR